MATNIPPHNLSEVVNALRALIDAPDMTCDDLMAYIPGPDFPTRGLIYGRQGIREAYRGGRGIIRVRARVLVEKDKRNQTETLVITELPYQVNKAKLIERIAELTREREIDGIRYVRDESDREGMRIAVGLKKEVVAPVVLNQLFKNTRMETTFGVIFLAIVNQRPELLNLKEILEHFILHRKDIVVRRTRFDLAKAEARAHILEGLKIALDHLDEVVALIRKSASPAEARGRLVAAYGLSEIQAQAILDMRLQRLTGLERDKILEEYKQVLMDIARFREILANERLVLQIIKDELGQIQQQYGDARLTEIVDEAREISVEDMIADEDMVVTISKRGYIKRNPITLYRSQRRGGKGVTAMGTREDDFVERLFVASTHHTFLFFTNLGKVYWCKCYDIPQAGRLSLGKAIVNLLSMEENEKLATVLAVPEFTPGAFVMMATKKGLVKKTDIMAYSRPRSGGIIAINLLEGDELIAARISDGTMNVFLGSAEGKAIRFHESDVRPSGRVASGVRGMKFSEGDHLVAMEVLNYGQTLFAVTENGYGKRTSIDEYPVHKRGGKGVIAIKASPRNGKVVAILVVDEEDDVMIMTTIGKVIRTRIKEISVISRNTQGVRLIGVDADAGERVVGAARLGEKDEEEKPEDAIESDDPGA